MSSRLSRPVGNWLLDALPDVDYGRLLDDLRPVSFPLGHVIYESGGYGLRSYLPNTFALPRHTCFLLFEYMCVVTQTTTSRWCYS